MIDDHPSFTWSNLTEKNLKFTETFWKCQCELCKMFYITQSQPSYKSLISYLIPVEIGICITIISISSIQNGKSWYFFIKNHLNCIKCNQKLKKGQKHFRFSSCGFCKYVLDHNIFSSYLHWGHRNFFLYNNATFYFNH